MVTWCVSTNQALAGGVPSYHTLFVVRAMCFYFYLFSPNEQRGGWGVLQDFSLFFVLFSLFSRPRGERAGLTTV